jgi:hypothetical protein
MKTTRLAVSRLSAEIIDAFLRTFLTTDTPPAAYGTS